MKYTIEQYRWDEFEGKRYYHLINAKDFESDKIIPERSYSKNGSYFTIIQIDDEVQIKPRRSKQRTRNFGKS